jgi:hypothetical protein
VEVFVIQNSVVFSRCFPMCTFYTMFLYKTYTTLDVEKGPLGSLQRSDVVIIIIKLEPSAWGDFWA